MLRGIIAVLMLTPASVPCLAAPANGNPSPASRGPASRGSGVEDFRISDAGTDLGSAVGAAVAFNSVDALYLVAWSADDQRSQGAPEIYARLVDAATGDRTPLYSDLRVSFTGADDEDTEFRAIDPAVAYSDYLNEFLVVWKAHLRLNPIAVDEQIWGQRLDGTTGAALGAAFQIDQNNGFAHTPDVAYNSEWQEYMVVWRGDHNVGGVVIGENEVWARKVQSVPDGDMMRVSHAGVDGSVFAAASAPSIAYNPDTNQYLVTWYANDQSGGLSFNEREIFGQLIDMDGAVVVNNDIRISHSLPDGDSSQTRSPRAAYNALDQEFLVVWHGDGEDFFFNEIYGQRLDGATATEIGADFFIAGADGVNTEDPVIAHDAAANEYLLAFAAPHPPLLGTEESEAWAQRLDATGTPVGPLMRASDVGPEGDTDFDVFDPAIALAAGTGECLLVWSGDYDGLGENENQLEIAGQRLLLGSAQETGANDFAISCVGAIIGSVAGVSISYNSVDDEFLVVWAGTDNRDPLPHLLAIGQRIDAATGLEIGDNDFQIGTLANRDIDVAHNPAANEYLVVWDRIFGQVKAQRIGAAGDAIGAELVLDSGGAFPSVVLNELDDEYFVVWAAGSSSKGQRVDAATGDPVGAVVLINDITAQDVVYNPAQHEYLVVGESTEGSVEVIRATRLDASTGVQLDNARTISDLAIGSYFARVGYRPASDEYAAVWQGHEFEISGVYLQRLSGAGAGSVGDNVLLTDPLVPSHQPELAYDGDRDEFLVVWSSSATYLSTVEPGDVFGGRLDGATGTTIAEFPFQLTSIGATGSGQNAWAGAPVAAYSPAGSHHLVAFRANDPRYGNIEEFETEVAGQLFAAPASTFASDPRAETTPPPIYSLTPVRPNPFNPRAHLELWVASAQRVQVDLVDVQGRLQRRVHEGWLAGGRAHVVEVDGSGLASGAYWVRVRGETFATAEKVTLMK